jgi:hypothetical protein
MPKAKKQPAPETDAVYMGVDTTETKPAKPKAKKVSKVKKADPSAQPETNDQLVQDFHDGKPYAEEIAKAEQVANNEVAMTEAAVEAAKERHADPDPAPDKRPPFHILCGSGAIGGLSTAQWEHEGRPAWWVAVGDNHARVFLTRDAGPGNQPLDYAVDLDAHLITPGTVIHYGVGKGNTGVRGSIPAPQCDEDRLHWGETPVAEETDLATLWHWWTRCKRYRVSRSIHKYDQEGHYFVAGLGKKILLKGRPRTLAGAIDLCEEHFKTKQGLNKLPSNKTAVVALAAQRGLDQLQTHKPKEVTAVKKPAFTVSADDFKALCAALGAEPSQELANAMDQFAGQKKKLKKAGVEDLFNDMVKHKGDVRVVGLRTGEKTDAYGFREGSVHSKAIAALTKTPLKMKD